MIKKIKDLNPKQKNILEIILIIILVIVVLLVNIIVEVLDAKKEQEESNKTILVQDNSRYFTVLGCAKKFLVEISKQDKENIILLLDTEYKNENNITTDNVLEYIPELSTTNIYDYVGSYMYQHTVSKNVTTFYLKGKIANYVLDDATTYIDYDLTITLYENTFTFTVKPGIGDLEYET